ncbi:hypothetical protein HPB48_017448 [Haemaphysalis longicornis]|uniref:Uncharacterized protein n=1 Tax=Haemaphysalis longicornis TaxID=44386 RepID=A0A9J6FTV6_HAELO|nr:hypothetical protein HPB48_017448 [Haemaphysalis longicornis]
MAGGRWHRLGENLVSDHYLITLRVPFVYKTLRRGTARITNWPNFRKDPTPLPPIGDNLDDWAQALEQRVCAHTQSIALTDATPAADPHLLHIHQLAFNVKNEIPYTSLTPALPQKEQRPPGSTGVGAPHGGPMPAASGRQCPVMPRFSLLISASGNQRPLAGVYGARRNQRRPTPQEYVPRPQPPLHLREPAVQQCPRAAEWGLFSAAKAWPHHDLTFPISRVVEAYRSSPNDRGDAVCVYDLPRALGRGEPRARCDCCLTNADRGPTDSSQWEAVGAMAAASLERSGRSCAYERKCGRCTSSRYGGRAEAEKVLLTDVTDVDSGTMGHLKASRAMDEAAAATRVTSAEECAAPPRRYFMSGELAVTCKSEIRHEHLPYAGPQKDQQAHGSAACLAAQHNTPPWLPVPIPAIDSDQPSTGLYGLLRYQRRPPQWYASWPYPPLELQNPFLRPNHRRIIIQLRHLEALQLPVTLLSAGMAKKTSFVTFAMDLLVLVAWQPWPTQRKPRV